MARLHRGLLLTALLYYWAYLYFRVALPPLETSPVSYLLTVGPIAAIAAAGALALLAARLEHPTLPRPAFWLLCFCIPTAMVAVLRGDAATALSAGLITLTLIWLTTASVTLSLGTINLLFGLSIVAAAFFHAAGLSEYGILPGQYAEGADRGITWRVSLFPYVPESGFFALVVLLGNQLCGRGFSRWIFSALAVYFLVFSGMRSALICLLLCVGLLVIDRRHRATWGRDRSLWRGFAAVGAAALFVTIVLSSAVLQLLPQLAQGPIGSYLFRADSVDVDVESIQQSVYRGWLWLQHMQVFLSSPWIGVGSYEFVSVVDDPMMAGESDTGTESLLTLWLSRVGLCFVPFLVFLWTVGRRASVPPQPLGWLTFVILCVALLAYGSFLVPYNFMFVLLFALLAAPVAADRTVVTQPRVPSIPANGAE